MCQQTKTRKPECGTAEEGRTGKRKGVDKFLVLTGNMICTAVSVTNLKLAGHSLDDCIYQTAL